MNSNRRSAIQGYALILAAACLWATIGLFYRTLVDEYGLSRQAVVAFRAGLAALAIGLWLAARRPAALKIRRADVPFFLGFGIFGVAAFYISYMAALTTGTVAQAAVLLYTAPIWIALWTAAHDGEALAGPRLLALGLAVIGCVFVAQAYNPAKLKLNIVAMIYGLLSGLGYATYSLGSASGMRRGYAAWTVVFYSVGIGAIVLFAVTPPDAVLQAVRLAPAWPALLGVALFTNLLAPICFTLGLQHVPATNASILATVEPVVAAGLAWIFLREPLSLPQLAGGACVLLAVLLLVTAQPRRNARPVQQPALRPEL